MSFKKYASRAFALFFFCRCTYNDKDAYVDKENKGYYTKNLYTLTNYQKLADTIQLASPDEISDLRKKLEERIPKWRITGTEPGPYELWSNFFEQEIAENIVKKLQEKHDTTLLAHYYDSLGRLFKRPTAAHEKALIAAVKALKANTVLMEAFKTRIEARYKEPEKILLMQSILDYQDFLYFILNDPSKGNSLHNKLKYYQLTLAKWQKDGYQTGKELWEQIQKEEEKRLESSKFYRYTDNQNAIKQSLSLIGQIRDNFYRLSYKDLLETLPHGINKLKEGLHELEKNEINNESANIKTLKKYLAIYPFSL